MRQLQRNKRLEVQGTFAANGTVTVILGPIPLGPSWELKQVSIRTRSATETLANTYVGTSSAGIFVSTSYTGNSDTDSSPNTTLKVGDSFCCIWTGGTPGTVATLAVIYDEVGY